MTCLQVYVTCYLSKSVVLSRATDDSIPGRLHQCRVRTSAVYRRVPPCVAVLSVFLPCDAGLLSP